MRLELAAPVAVRRCLHENVGGVVDRLAAEHPRPVVVVTWEPACAVVYAYPHDALVDAADAVPPAPPDALGRLRITGVNITDGQVAFTLAAHDE